MLGINRYQEQIFFTISFNKKELLEKYFISNVGTKGLGYHEEIHNKKSLERLMKNDLRI